MNKKEIITFEGNCGMAGFLADFIVQEINGLPSDQFLNIALSGGNTPKAIFEQIRLHHKEKIDWHRIRFFQVDERGVPPDDPQSNYRMISESLLGGVDFPVDQFIRMRGEADPQEEAQRYAQRMKEILPSDETWPIFDLILLGLGNDGHTASLFPGDEAILISGEWCEVAQHPESGQKRITLTLPVINHARYQIFLVTGHEKAVKVNELIEGNPGKHYPASLVTPEKGDQIWLLDQHAARLLPPGLTFFLKT
jgi:6-phosphogluconolactonase